MLAPLADLTRTYDWSQIIVSITIVLAFFGTIVAFLVRRFVKWLDGKLSAIDKKATPNGGHTLDLGDTASRSETKLDELRDLFLYHLAHHPGATEMPSDLVPVSLPSVDTLAPTRKAVAADNVNDHGGQHHSISAAAAGKE